MISENNINKSEMILKWGKKKERVNNKSTQF